MPLDRKTLMTYLDRELAVDIESLGDDDALFTTGVIDSFGIVDLIEFIETETGTTIRPAQIRHENLDSVTIILNFAARLAASETPAS